MAVAAPTTVCTYLGSAAVTTSGAQTLTAAVPLNALLMVTVAGGASTVTYGVSDSQTHTWTPLTIWTQATGTLMSVQVFYTKITTALTTSDTITVTRSNSNSLEFVAEYVTGQHLTVPIGNSGTTPTNNSATTVTTLSTAAVTANNGDMTRAAIVITGNSINVTSVALTVTNSVVNTVATTRRMATGHRIAVTNETPTPDFSWNTANVCAMGAYVIQTAAAPDPWTYSKIARFGV